VERYSKYKDSGVYWVKQIPSEWSVCPTKRVFRNTKEIVGSRVDDFERLALTMNGVIRRSKEDAEGLQPREFNSYQILRENELVFKLIDLENVRTSRVGLSPFEGIVSPAYIILANSETDNRYYYYYFMDLYHRNIFNHLGGDGVRSSLNASDLLSIPILVVDSDSRNRIADYIEWQLFRIDGLISNLTKQVAMLDIYKYELVGNAITKGLNRSRATKDSGVDWIGEIPTHWETTKIKWMFEIVKRIYGKEDRDVLSITQRGIKVKDTELNEGQLAESYANYQVVNVNDFAMNSMDLLTGWVDCSPFEGVTSPDYRVFRFLPGKEQCHNYYKYLFQMCYKNRIFYRLGQGVSNLGRWRLQADQFLNMRLPQPPVDEQEKIAAYLDEKTAKIEGLIADITAQIEMLKQYRQIVIHDAVTGKIKVTEG